MNILGKSPFIPMKVLFKSFLLWGSLSVLVYSETPLIEKPHSNQEQRIVSIGAGITEMIFTLGAGERIVAVDSSSTLPESSTLPKLGYHRALNSEGILSLSPTLVIATHEMGPPHVLEQLKKVGIPIFILPENSSLLENIAYVGKIVNKKTETLELIKKTEQNLDNLKQQVQQDNRPLSLIFLMLSKQRPPTAAGSDTPIQDIAKLFNAKNLADSLTNYHPYSNEKLIVGNPHVILLAARTFDGDIDKLALSHLFITQTRAFKNRCIFPIDGKALLGSENLTTVAEASRIYHLIRTNNLCQGSAQ